MENTDLKVWILYALDFGYPEDPEVSAWCWRICKDEEEAKELRDLVSEAHRLATYPSWRELRDEARKTLKEKYNLNWEDIPDEHFKIMEGKLDEVC